MINNYIGKINELNQHESFIKREVVSRVVSVALTALCYFEAAYNTGVALAGCLGSVVITPIVISLVFASIVSGKKSFKNGCRSTGKLYNDLMLQPCIKAIYTAATIPLTPFVGLFSPRALVALHYEFGTASALHKNEAESTEAESDTSENLANSQALLNIRSEFLSWHTNPTKKLKLKEAGLSPPKTLLLYGPAKNGKQTAVESIGKTLGMNRVAIFKGDMKIDIETYNPKSDLIYLKKRSDLSAEVRMLEKKGFIVVASLEEKIVGSDDFEVQIEVPLPSYAERFCFWNKKLESKPIGSLTKVTEATERCTLKEMERISKRALFTALAQNKTVSADSFLEALRNSGRSVGAPEEVNDFVGFEEVFKIFDKYLRVMKNPAEAKEYGAQMPAGMILYGAPGCGKTYTAKHLTTYAKSKGVALGFKQIKASDIAAKWKGEGVKNIKKAFDEAKAIAPCVLFIDECEGLFPSRDKLCGTLAEERTQELDEALQMIEDAKKHGVIVIGATNHLKSIDSAILRTGRFDFTYEVKPPDEATRLKMIQKKLETRTKHLDSDINYEEVAKATDGFTASDVDSLVNDACNEAWRQDGKVSEAILMDSVAFLKQKRDSVENAGKKHAGSERENLRGLVQTLEELYKNYKREENVSVAGSGDMRD